MPDLRANRVVLVKPGMDSVQVTKDLVSRSGRTFDVYRPADASGKSLPAVVFVPGDAPEEVIAGAKDWGQYVSWGQLTAVSGLAAVTVNHRSTNSLRDLAGAALDVDSAVEHIRANLDLGIDRDRIAIWTCSAGAPFALRTALRDRPRYLKAIVALYSIMDLAGSHGVEEDVIAEFSCRRYLESGGAFPPMLVVRAGRDSEFINRSIEAFVATAIASGVDVEYMNHAEGEHAFDIRNDVPRTREIVQRTLDFLVSSLRQD